MKFLLTGATGMVGSHLAEALAARFGGENVVALTNPAHTEREGPRERLLSRLGVRMIPFDLFEGGTSDSLPDFDVVYHLAAYLQSADHDGTEVLIDSLGKKSVTWIYTGETSRENKRVQAVEARLVTVCLDMDSFSSVEVPRKYRELFKKFLVGGESGS